MCYPSSRHRRGLTAPYLDSQRSGLPWRKPMLDIRRREFIALLGGAAAWPIAARAQAALPVIGILSGATFESMNAFLAVLSRLGERRSYGEPEFHDPVQMGGRQVRAPACLGE